MRKDDLIKLLENVKGNPEIMVWNGFVEDVVKLEKIEKGFLCRLKKKIQEAYSAFQKEKNTKLNRSWFFPCGLEDEEDHEKKNIIILVPKCEGKTTWDRTGIIKY